MVRARITISNAGMTLLQAEHMPVFPNNLKKIYKFWIIRRKLEILLKFSWRSINKKVLFRIFETIIEGDFYEILTKIDESKKSIENEWKNSYFSRI